jgi:hypothetical protein
LFFDQQLFLDQNPSLSTFLLSPKTIKNHVHEPVDKSVTKLWKDCAEGRGYWLGAIVALTGQSCNLHWATPQVVEGQAKNFLNLARSPVGKGFTDFVLAPKDCGPACG